MSEWNCLWMIKYVLVITTLNHNSLYLITSIIITFIRIGQDCRKNVFDILWRKLLSFEIIKDHYESMRMLFPIGGWMLHALNFSSGSNIVLACQLKAIYVTQIQLAVSDLSVYECLTWLCNKYFPCSWSKKKKSSFHTYVKVRRVDFRVIEELRVFVTWRKFFGSRSTLLKSYACNYTVKFLKTWWSYGKVKLLSTGLLMLPWLGPDLNASMISLILYPWQWWALYIQDASIKVVDVRAGDRDALAAHQKLMCSQFSY